MTACNTVHYPAGKFIVFFFRHPRRFISICHGLIRQASVQLFQYFFSADRYNGAGSKNSCCTVFVEIIIVLGRNYAADNDMISSRPRFLSSLPVAASRFYDLLPMSSYQRYEHHYLLHPAQLLPEFGTEGRYLRRSHICEGGSNNFRPAIMSVLSHFSNMIRGRRPSHCSKSSVI